MGGDAVWLLDKVHAWEARKSASVLHSFLDQHGDAEDRLTWGALVRRSTALKDRLLAKGDGGLSAGDRALLTFPPGLDFVVAFYACLEAGVVAVPVFPPDPRRGAGDVAMFALVACSSGAAVSLTNERYSSAKRAASVFSSDGWPVGLRWLVCDTDRARCVGVAVGCAAAAGNDTERAALSSLAFLQYTSGSTSEPKGVMISRANLAHNLALITSPGALDAGEDTVVVSWLPQYHDMGLIGSYLGTAYCGGRGFHSSPITFIRDPTRWVRDMTRYGATHVQAPSFAYGLCARKFLSRPDSERPFVDLSALRHCINAAEPVRASDVDAFVATFAPLGLAPSALRPTYGLAEHTVLVCTNGTLRYEFDATALETDRQALVVAEGGKTLFGCGRAPAGLAIVDETAERSALPEGRVGEIWLRSGSRAAGYFRQPEKSAADFGAALAEDACCGEASALGVVPACGWLRTGDLGFVHEGELFVCGRIKDLLIVRGRNHYPQDLEKTSEDAAAGAFRSGCSAAVVLQHEETSDERVQLLVEQCDGTDLSRLPSVIEEVRRAVANAHGVQLGKVTVVPSRSAPKTTSGKIARKWCAKALADPTFKATALYVWSEDGEQAVSAPGAALVRTGLSAQDSCEKRVTPEEKAAKKRALGELDDAALAARLAEITATVLKVRPDSLDADAPIATLGLGSMEGMQLLATIEDAFGIAPPPELVFDGDLSLRTLGIVLRRDGKVGDRAVVLDGAALAQAVAQARLAPPAPANKLQALRTERRRRALASGTRRVSSRCP